jgi:hypothetical protein
MDELYEDLGGDYFLLDYSSSHSEMVIRRIDKSDQSNVFNIDLFFKGGKNINIAAKLEGVSIYKSRVDAKPSLMLPPRGREIFKIVSSQERVGFIDAYVFVVFHNHLGILESSLGDFTGSEGNKEVFGIVINKTN